MPAGIFFMYGVQSVASSVIVRLSYSNRAICVSGMSLPSRRARMAPVCETAFG